MGRVVLWNACLHHILDLLVEAAVVEKLGPTSGPTEKYFSRFEAYFNSLTKEEKVEISAEGPTRVAQVAPEDEVTREFLDATKTFFSEMLMPITPTFSRASASPTVKMPTLKSGSPV